LGLLVWLVDTLFTIVTWAIIIRVIISWIRPNNMNPNWRKILTYIYKITEPILGPIRRILPTGSIGIDFSPFIAIIALQIVRNFLIRLLHNLMYGI